MAQERGALVYDLHAFFRRVANEGIAVGSRRLTAEFLGGFYGLNGYYPGATGHALIANELLGLLNSAYGANFPPIDVDAVSLSDPVADYRQAEGPTWTTSELLNPQPRPSYASPTSPVPSPPSYVSAAHASVPRDNSGQMGEVSTRAPAAPPRSGAGAAVKQGSQLFR